MEGASVNVLVRLGRKQTPFRYSTVEAIDRDLAAAYIRLSQMTKDREKQAADVLKLEEAASRLRRNLAALDDAKRAGRRARKTGTTSPSAKDDG